MSVIQIQFRRDTAANWTSANPTLASGEQGLDTTNLRLKMGDGATAWNSLAYLSTRILSGSGAPAGGLGVDGDLYYDTTNTRLYGPKAAGAWGAGVSLVGPQGIQGIQGIQGNPGVSPNAFTTITGNTGTATADTASDSLSIVGSGAINVTATDNPEVLTITVPAGTITNAMQTNMAANTLSGNATASPAAPQDIAVGANQILGRSSTGDIGLKTVSNAGFALLAAADAAAETALLDAATSTLKGLILAAEKNRISTTNLWFDIVADGGADRTGSVDATTIFQNALNTVGSAGGGTVYIPPNCTLKTSANININNPFITILGGSRVTSKIVPTHATGNVFTVASGAGPNGFVRFENMRIQPATNNLRTAGYGIEVTSTVPNCSIQRVDILFQWSAIKASGQLCRMEDLGLRECGYGATGGCMVLIDTFTDQYIKAVVCDNGTVAPNAPQSGFAGVRITNLSSLLMADCQWIHCGNGLDVVPASTNGVPSIYCMNTFFDQGIIGANFVSGSGSIVRNRFIGCWFSGNSTAGVVMNGANINGLDFIGCEFYGAPSQPVGIDAIAVQEWSVRSSRIAGNSTAGIRTTAASTHNFTISDNIIGNVSGVAANALGINIQAGTYGRYQILDNRGLESNTTPGITDLGVVAVTSQKNVANNMGAILKGALQLNSSAGAAVIAGRGAATSGTGATFLFGTRIPANAVSAGQTFRISCWGQASSTGTSIFTVYAGAAGTTADTVISTHGVSAAAAANGYVYHEAMVTVAALGPTATVAGAGQTSTAAATIGKTAAAEVVANVPTTAPWFISVSATHSIGTLTVRHAAIEAL